VKVKRKPTSQNKFKVIASKVMQCGVRKGVSIKRQEIEKKRVQCFRYWGMEQYKWEYPNIKVKKEKRRSKEAVCTEYIPKKCSTRGKGLEDEVGNGNICRVWRM